MKELPILNDIPNALDVPWHPILEPMQESSALLAKAMHLADKARSDVNLTKGAVTGDFLQQYADERSAMKHDRVAVSLQIAWDRKEKKRYAHVLNNAVLALSIKLCETAYDSLRKEWHICSFKFANLALPDNDPALVVIQHQLMVVEDDLNKAQLKIFDLNQVLSKSPTLSQHPNPIHERFEVIVGRNLKSQEYRQVVRAKFGLEVPKVSVITEQYVDLEAWEHCSNCRFMHDILAEIKKQCPDCANELFTSMSEWSYGNVLIIADKIMIRRKDKDTHEVYANVSLSNEDKTFVRYSDMSRTLDRFLPKE